MRKTMILFISINGKEVDTAINLSKIVSIEKRDTSTDNYCIYFCHDLQDSYYTLHFEDKEKRDNKFKEYTTAWKTALGGDCA